MSPDSQTTTFGNELKQQQHGDVIYGHIHVGKTGGTSLNGLLANRFERVCGHKGYSYDAYAANEKAKQHIATSNDSIASVNLNFNMKHDRIFHPTMEEIGYEDCDYVSSERYSTYEFFIDHFGNRTFHGLQMELHVPCRDPIDHLMSKCNMQHKQINCTYQGNNYTVFKQSVMNCIDRNMDRYHHTLKTHFSHIKCYDYRKQFTSYMEYMTTRLQPRRIVSTPYIQRDTNPPRNKTDECIWNHPDLMQMTRTYLLKAFDWHQFCWEECMGSDNEITRE